MQQHMLNLATSCHAATHAEPCHIMPYMLLADKQIPLTAIAAAVMGRHHVCGWSMHSRTFKESHAKVQTR